MELIQLFFAIFYLIEAKLEVYVIALKNGSIASYKELNRLEHKWSFIYASFLAVSSALLYFWVYGLHLGLFAFLASVINGRRLFFDYPLKKLRNRNLKDIEGDQFFDRTIRRIFGPKGGYKELVLLILVQLVAFFLIQHFTPQNYLKRN
jgi:hypothetical protein